ncbi:MAG: restriction endonuclease subunit S [Anaerolineae bacterium]|nr:restriction endonuclease subunit S [Anaerolineae bacterium]
MIPEGWTKTTLGSICELSNGHGFRPPDWSSEGLPIIRIQNLNGSKEFNYFAGSPDPDWIVEPNTMLFAWAGTRGVSFGPTIWRGPRGVLNQHIYRVLPQMTVDPIWLYSVLEIITHRIEAKAHGFKSTLVHVHKSDITGQDVFLPPLPEQRKIAAILSTWDEAITLVGKLIAALKRRKQALMQLLLTGAVRFPGFEEEWEEVEIGAFLTESRISGSDGVTARKITVRLYGKGVYPKEETRAGSENTRYYVRRAGQFIYSKLDFLNGAFGIIPTSMDGYESTLDLPAFDISPAVNPPYFLSYVSREPFYESFRGQAKGGRKARRVAPDEFLETVIEIPSLPEQDRISDIILLLQAHIDICLQYHNHMVEQKRGLMQQLLTGAIRVQGEA